MEKEGTEESSEHRPCEEILSNPNRGKLVLDFKAVAKHPLGFLRAIGPFLSAHHPLCSFFEGHTITIRNRTYCVGCLFNSIFFLSAFSILLVTWFINPLLVPRFYVFWGGVAAVGASLLFSVAGLTDYMKLKIFAKFLLGSGFAAVTVGILIYGDDIFFDFITKIIFILMMYVPVMTLMNGKRMWEIERECNNCDFKMRWSKCPGFKDIVCRNVEEGFLKPEEPSKK